MTRMLTRPAALVRTFMTHEMGDEDIAALSTGREGEFHQIMEAIRRSRAASPGPLQHVVLYGSRGFGKSFMTRRVQIATGDIDEPEGRVLYVLLPEEQHNLQRSPHAFLDTIRHHLRNLQESGDAAFEEAHFQWPRRGEDNKQWNDAASALEEAVDKVLPDGKGLVIVVVENFDSLLSTLFGVDEAEQRLRLWLDRPNNRLMLLATATGTVDIDYDRPLFKAFEPVRLSAWSGDDCIAYFNKLRDREGRASLTPSQEAKGRAIAEFIGGTPRLAQLLAEVIDTQDALTVAETMSALADKLAEYYRRRIEDLPPLARGLLDALIRGGEPASQTELASRVGARGQSDIARVMSDLQRADIIRGRRAVNSREMLYSVTDRVFVHYYRLRQGSRAARSTPLATILEFLRSFYSREEQLEQVVAHLTAGRPAEASLFSSLALEGRDQPEGAYISEGAGRLKAYSRTLKEIDSQILKSLANKLNSDPATAFSQCDGANVASPYGSVLISLVRAQALCRLGLEGKAESLLRDLSVSPLTPAETLAVTVELSLLLRARREDASTAADLLRSILSSSEHSEVPPAIRTVALMEASTIPEDNSIQMEEAVQLAGYAAEAVTAAKSASLKHDELVARSRHLLLSGLLDRDDVIKASYPEALSLADELEAPEVAAFIGWQAAAVLRKGDEYEVALPLIDKALERLSSSTNEEALTGALYEKAAILFGMGRYAETVEVSSQGLPLARKLGHEEAEADFLRLRANSSMRTGSVSAAFEDSEAFLALAEKIGQSRVLRGAVLTRMLALLMIGNHEDDVIQMLDRAQELDDPLVYGAAVSLALTLARDEPRRNLIRSYADVIRLSETRGTATKFDHWVFLNIAVAGSARAEDFTDVDALISEFPERISEHANRIAFAEQDGAVIARLAQEVGRARAFQAAAGLLSRVKALSAYEPATRTDSFRAIAVGLASASDHAGLLLDVADYIAQEFPAEGQTTLVVLRTVAKVLEAENPETILTRLDPDLETLIRRIRNLPREGKSSRKQGREMRTNKSG